MEFPEQSLQPLVNRIKAEGFVPGLWMAPFSCDKHSLVAEKHPDWVLRGANGTPMNSANCGGWVVLSTWRMNTKFPSDFSLHLFFFVFV
jgi:alpha-galactosidase